MKATHFPKWRERRWRTEKRANTAGPIDIQTRVTAE